jgi:hypothetical protein
VVRSSKGTSLEGISIQLVSHTNAIRTTVHSDRDGKYEFPKLDAGWYRFASRGRWNISRIRATPFGLRDLLRWTKLCWSE